MTTKSWCVVVWRQCLPCSKGDYLIEHLLEKRSIFTCQKCGSRKNAVILSLFALVQQRPCFNIGGFAEKGRLLSEQRNIMLKLGCISLNKANSCLHNSTTAKFHPFTKNIKDWLSKACGDMIARPSNRCIRKFDVHKSHIQKITYVFESIFGKDASQPYADSMCQPMPTGLHTRYKFDLDFHKFKPRQNELWSFGKNGPTILTTKETEL